MALLYSKFQFFSFTLPPNYYHHYQPPIKWIWEMLTISNYYNTTNFNLKCQPPVLFHTPTILILILNITLQESCAFTSECFRVMNPN